MIAVEIFKENKFLVCGGGVHAYLLLSCCVCVCLMGLAPAGSHAANTVKDECQPDNSWVGQGKRRSNTASP